jgi:hypothetical protein
MLAAGTLDIADAFSTDLYAGNSSTQTITNGIDLDGEGGLVWIKSRSTAYNHYLIDSERGITQKLNSDSTGAQAAQSDISSFNSDGFSLSHYWGGQNFSGHTFVAWTFRKAPKFFDVVTYTGDGVAGREIAHNLEATVGWLVIKRLDSTGTWFNYHDGLSKAGDPQALILNETSASFTANATLWNLTYPTSTHFTVGTNGSVNASGGTYVAYLFAHDTDDDSVIQCGSYTGNGSATGPVVTLGWEPQWLLIKRSDGSTNWVLYDNQRSPSNPLNDVLYVDTSNAEAEFTVLNLDFNSTGFQLKGTNGQVNASGGTYIYMAIRKEGA